MALTDLTPYVTAEVTLGATFAGYRARGARNLVVSCDSAFFVNWLQTDQDGATPAAGNRQWFPAGLHSVRAPTSGCGDQTSGRPDSDSYIAFAAVSGTPTLYVTAVPDNVST